MTEKDIENFYHTTAWRNKRLSILDRDNNECQVCKLDGKVSVADCVHHMQHLTDSPELALEETNLTTLCNACHNKVHPEKLDNENKINNKFENEERWE